MTQRTAVRVAVVTFGLYAAVVHWPGVLPFSGPRPFVLGLPFNFFWIILWIVLGGAALTLLELTRGPDGPSGDAVTAHARREPSADAADDAEVR
jgi:hypothetical protein